MQLAHGIHLAYSTNVHRGESWAETFEALSRHTLKVREAVSSDRPYGIGLRLSDLASRELSDSKTLRAFRRWLDQHQCYVFTINGFPFGQFHGTRVKEQVYVPDWSTRERLDYTNRLFNILSALLPEGVAGSVSTSPGSFKAFVNSAEHEQAMRDHLWQCVEYIARLSLRSGRHLHLGLEPEPLGYLENTAETLALFDRLHEEHPGDPRVYDYLGINYDTCHFAVEFEDATESLTRLRKAGVRISKIHLSNALRLEPTAEALQQLRQFEEDTYLHQVIVRHADNTLTRFRDLDQFLAPQSTFSVPHSEECRVHFHIPLHEAPAAPLHDTRQHLIDTLDFLAANPTICEHLEMETYTWEVLPQSIRARAIEDQLIAEYAWTLDALGARGFPVVS